MRRRSQNDITSALPDREERIRTVARSALDDERRVFVAGDAQKVPRREKESGDIIRRGC